MNFEVLCLASCISSRMQPAFLLGIFPPPPTGTGIFPLRYCPSTRCATNTYKSFVMERVVGDFIFLYEADHLIKRPIKQWVIFDNVIGFVPFKVTHGRTVCTLF